MNRILRLASVAGMTVMALSAQAIMIDDFNSGQYSIVANSGNPNVEAVRSGSMVGGERDALVHYGSGPGSVSASVGSGSVQFFNSSSETNGSLTLQYDGMDGEVEDGHLHDGNNLGSDFSGSNAFQFDFRFVDAGLSANLSILTTVVTGSGTATFLSVVSNGTNIHHLVDFSNFGGVDWKDVQRVQFEFTGSAATDFTLDSIQTVESIPGPLAAIPFIVGFASLRKRRR